MLDVRFSADYVRFGPKSGRIDTVTVESARDPKRTKALTKVVLLCVYIRCVVRREEAAMLRRIGIGLVLALLVALTGKAQGFPRF